MSSPDHDRPRGDDVRGALLVAAMKLFGDKGFEATSTREIATAAKTKTAMIAYYFGGKEGLRAACTDILASRLRELCDTVTSSPIDTPEEARAAVIAMSRALVRNIVGGGGPGAFEQFLMREITSPSPSFERLFDSALSSIHRRGLEVLALANGGDPGSIDLRIQYATLIGQIFYFRLARLPFLRRMGWSDIGPEELAAIEAVVVRNTEAVLDGAKAGASRA